MPSSTCFAMLLTWVHASPVLLPLLLVMKGCMLRLPVPVLNTVCCPIPRRHACRE